MMQVCVLFGGVSSEHDVSLRSAKMVLDSLDRDRYEVFPVGITRDGRWLYYFGPEDLIPGGKWEHSPFVCPAMLSADHSSRGIRLFPGRVDAGTRSERLRRRVIAGKDEFAGKKFLPVDVVFPVLHGRNGEDGSVQGMMQLAGIACVGCGVLASAACMDKEVAHSMMVQSGIPKARLVCVRRPDLGDMAALEARLAVEAGYPMFVKPANAGSSVGISKVKTPDDLSPALSLAFEHDDKVVVEGMVFGQEVECAVMGNEDPVASDVVGEIAPQNEFYDYAGKYLDDSTALYIPARISAEAVARVRELAVRAYRAMGCRGMARVDFFVKASGEVVLNEINTIPGFTSISMFPMLFEKSGIPGPQLIDRLIGYAMEAADA